MRIACDSLSGNAETLDAYAPRSSYPDGSPIYRTAAFEFTR